MGCEVEEERRGSQTMDDGEYWKEYGDKKTNLEHRDEGYEIDDTRQNEELNRI